LLDVAGYWTRMQRVHYLTLGVGDFFLAPVMSRGQLAIRNVLPHNVYLTSEPESPSVPCGLWELRIRWLPLSEEWVYCWDQYDLGRVDDGEETRPPSLRVVRADRALDDPTADVSTQIMQRPALVGPAYPFRALADDAPLLPYGYYRSSDSGDLWNWLEKRGAARGALNSILYHTYAGRCARDASGSCAIVSGLDPMTGTRPVGDGSGIVTLDLEAGALLYHTQRDGEQPFVQVVGPGAKLEDVSGFATAYTIQQMVHWGLSPADITRQHANPTSGQALFLSAKAKREAAAIVEPMFRAADLRMLQVIVSYLRAVHYPGAETYPETGYSITYAEIPESPDEEQGRRELDDWQADRGMLSRVELYQRWHPGASREDAIAAYVQAARDGAEIEARINAAVPAAPTPPPPPPVEAPDEPAAPPADEEPEE
jgi:hypothetical protein